MVIIIYLMCHIGNILNNGASRNSVCTDLEMFYSTGEGNTLQLGDPPRALYPLVILMTVPSDQIKWDNNDIVSHYFMLNLKYTHQIVFALPNSFL